MGKIPVFHRKRKVDWLGGVLLMASAVVFMLVLTWGGNRYLWLSPAIMAMVGASVALAFAFVWHAGSADEPFLPLPLMGGTRGALRDGRRRLRDGRDDRADRASAALLRGGLSPQRQRGGACADSAGRGFDRAAPRSPAGPWRAPNTTSGSRSSALSCAAVAACALTLDNAAAVGAAGAAVGVRAGARHGISDQRGRRCRIRWRGRRSAPSPAR